MDTCVDLLRSNTATLQQAALGELWSRTSADNADTATGAALRQAGAVPLLVQLLHSRCAVTRLAAAAVLGNMLIDDTADPTRGTSADAFAAGAVRPLVALLHSGVHEHGGGRGRAREQEWEHALLAKRYAAGALECITDGVEGSGAAMLAAGAAAPLVKLLACDDVLAQRRAAGALWSVAGRDGSARAAVRDAGAVRALVGALRGGGQDAGLLERALGALGAILDENTARCVGVICRGLWMLAGACASPWVCVRL